MRITERHTQVVIIGAGPSGLMMAAQLLRNGVQPVIIDSRQGPTSHSKALAVQARSVEIYRQMGLADELLLHSTHAEGVKLYQQGKEAAALSLAEAGLGQTLFPHIYLYEQSKNERLLLNDLTRHCCPVYWDTTLTGLVQHADHVTLQLKTSDQEYTLNCDWLIGADGAHSTLRHQLQIPFKGDTYPHEFFLADVRLKQVPFEPKEVQLYLNKARFAAFFPMQEENAYRIVGSIPVELATENLQLDDMSASLNQTTGFTLQPEQCRWFTTYRLHHRMAEKFNHNRCFLIGDAAHIHSPVGGQGMNTGLQDAYNLAWKLAGVVKQQLLPDILNTYAAERMPVAAELLKTTDRAFNLITSKSLVAGLFKKLALPRLLNWLWKNEKVRKIFFAQVSQTGISYRNSKLSLHLSQAGAIKAGDRLPYLKIYDEKKKRETDLHAWCGKPGFTLITIGPLNEQELFTFAKWITQGYSSYLNFFHLPPSDKNQQVFDRFEIKQGHIKALVVRPDMYIGLLSDMADVETVGNYLRNVVGMN
jgi:2-polyprenyl-6-methoxyphenol hydroxylase-like FAD-dependent oxidoreductase